MFTRGITDCYTCYNYPRMIWDIFQASVLVFRHRDSTDSFIQLKSVFSSTFILSLAHCFLFKISVLSYKLKHSFKRAVRSDRTDLRVRTTKISHTKIRLAQQVGGDEIWVGDVRVPSFANVPES